jgi:hypothetical protein
MKEEPVDPRMEKLVASLYKELPEAEERELQELLKRDPALKAEWDDLVSMRSMLGEWEVEERVPSFVMVDPEPARRVRVGGFWGEFRQRFGGFFAVSGWAVATAAIVVLILTVKGYHLEKIDGGFALRTGPRSNASEVQPAGEMAQSNTANPGTSSEGTVPPPVERVSPEASTAVPPRDTAPAPVRSEPPAGSVQLVGGPYVTRQEMEEKSLAMVRTFAELLNDDRSRRDAQMASMLRTVYGSLNDKQMTDYQELRGRIEAVGLGLMAEQSRTNERLELMQQTVVDSLGLENQSPDQNGGEKK